MVPPSKCITSNMLNRNFYDNHTFFQSEYDSRMYVNMNGRVLELKQETKFQTYLGIIIFYIKVSEKV